MNELLEGLILGYSVCIPFGPVNILILSAALISFKQGFALGLGAMLADMLYLLLLKFGITTFLTDFILDIISVCGFLYLCHMSYSLFKADSKIILKEDKFEHNVLKSFLKGFGLNLLNPFVIGFWLSVASYLTTVDNYKYLFFGLFISIFSWIFLLSFLSSKLKHFFTAKILKTINIISAFMILYFAIMLILRRFFGF